MKVAYLTSKYPAVSHTFVMREVAALRAIGVDVGTFSVRRPTSTDVLGDEAVSEFKRTRWLVWARPSEYSWAMAWGLGRPVRLWRALAGAVGQRGMGLRQRAQWACYLAEATLLARWLTIGGYQHLHCHFGNNGASTGMLAAELAGIPFSMTCHGSELLEVRRHGLVRKVEQAAFVACISHYGRAQLMMACPPEQWPKLQVIRCGVPAAVPSARADRRADTPTILCVGRLSAEKGHLILLEALAKLRDRGCAVKCLLVGDGTLRGAVEARAAQLRLDGSLSMAGSRPSHEVMKLYGSADLVVLPSFSEGVPVVLMEAMAAGCPVVATQVGGVGELVRDHVTGKLVPPGHPDALATAIEWMLENPAAAQSMAAEARRVVDREFCQETSAARLAGLFGRNGRHRAPDETDVNTGVASCRMPHQAESC